MRQIEPLEVDLTTLKKCANECPWCEMDTLWVFEPFDFFCCLCAQWWTLRPTEEELAAEQKRAELCSIAARHRRDLEMLQQAPALRMSPGHINQIQFMQAIQNTTSPTAGQMQFLTTMEALGLLKG